MSETVGIDCVAENRQQSVELVACERDLILQFRAWFPVLQEVREILLEDGFQPSEKFEVLDSV